MEVLTKNERRNARVKTLEQKRNAFDGLTSKSDVAEERLLSVRVSQ